METLTFARFPFKSLWTIANEVAIQFRADARVFAGVRRAFVDVCGEEYN